MNRIVYARPPKTGGVSIITALRSVCDFDNFKRIREGANVYMGHCVIEDRLGDKVALSVRNPYDRVHSLYHYYNRFGKDISLPCGMGFRDFVMSIESIKPNVEMNRAMLFPCSRFVRDGKPDFIIRFENICEDFRSLCDFLGVDCRLGHLNRNDRKTGCKMSDFNHEMIEKVNDYFHEDFVNFNYEKVE